MHDIALIEWMRAITAFQQLVKNLEVWGSFLLKIEARRKKKIVIFFRRILIYKKCQVPWEIAFRYFEYFDNQELCLPNAF